MRKRLVWLVFALMAGGAGPAAAQVAWDAPMLMPPSPPAGFGIYLLEAAGGDLGVMGTWRGAGSSLLGFRGGIAEQEFTDDLAVFGGIDLSGRLVRVSVDFPLDVDWVAGAGLSAEEFVLLSIPFGVTLGRRLDAEGAAFTPYGMPRIVLDACLDCAGDDDIELDFAFDVGVDVALRQGWGIRFGATLSDEREALAIGIIF